MLKLKTTKNFLLKAIQSAQRGISSTTTVPIIQNILIEVEEERATCSGTDILALNALLLSRAMVGFLLWYRLNF